MPLRVREAVRAAAFGTADAACAAVYTFLSKQAGYDPANPRHQQLAGDLRHEPAVAGRGRSLAPDVTSTPRATSPWSPTSSYSGPLKPTIVVFKEVPFTSELGRVQLPGRGPGRLRVPAHSGYHPADDQTRSCRPANNPRLTDFTLAPLYSVGINFFPENFNSTGDNGNAGAIFKQLYFRQALQDLVDQPLFDHQGVQGLRGAHLRTGPRPAADLLRLVQEKSNPYPYSVTQGQEPARRATGGRSCRAAPPPAPTRNGSNSAGPNIPAGAELNFNLQYATGTTWITQLMNTEKSSWAQAGYQHHAELGLVRHRARHRRAVHGRPSCTLGARRTGAAAGSSPPTTTRPARRSSPPVPGSNSGATRTPPTTPTPRPPTPPTSTWTRTRTSWPRTCRWCGSPTRRTRCRRSATSSTAPRPRTSSAT